MTEKTDTERLNWLIFHSAKVCHSKDAEICSVRYNDEEDTFTTHNYDDARSAIDAAIDGKVVLY